MARINLDEIDAAHAEETLEPHVIDFVGETFTIPNEREWPAWLAAHVERNELSVLFETILGPQDWARLIQAGERSKKGTLTMTHLEGIMRAIARAQQLASLGESPDGGGSSETTGEPLSQTSNGSTGYGSAGRSRPPRPPGPAPSAPATGPKRSRAKRGPAKPASPRGGSKG